VSQNDFNIANQGFPSFRSDLNNALQALASNNAGAAEPSTTYANQWWYDTTTGLLKLRNEANTNWVAPNFGEISNVNITGGTIDGAVIGGTTPAAITGTTLTATGAFTSLGIDDNATSTAITIDASGNVGIGTISANSARLRLHNAGTSGAPQLMLTSIGTSSQSEIRHETSNSLVFNNWNGVSRTETMRIYATGDVGFGVPASNSNGKVIQASDGYIFFSSRAGTATATHNLFVNANGAVGSIQTTNSSTSYNTSSDYRLKENITPIQGAGDIVKAMRPCTYTFKADGDWADGFLAHELQELHPVAVSGSKDAMKDEEYEVTPAVEATYDAEGVELTPAEPAVMGTRSVPDYQGVDYSKLTPILTAALQEALNKIDALEARLAALEATP